MTTIHYDVADAGPVRITLHDVSGRLVGVLLDRSVGAGRGSVTWSGHGERGERLAAGRYFLRIEGRKVEGNSSATCPIVLNQ
jgi:flagellar hook assembly protein FlgD